MQNIIGILQAAASVAWPAFAFTALFMFKREIAQAIGRIKRGKLLGQEFELNEQLERLEASAAAATEEVKALPYEDDRTANADRDHELNSTIKAVLRQAAASPKTALIMLQYELERQARRAIATLGMLRDRPNLSMRDALSELGQYGLPPNMSGSLKLFSDVRNKLIHGSSATDDDILKAVDSGITILKAVNDLEVNMVVYHPGVDIFSDASCSSQIPDVKGVILETISPGGVIKDFRIFPTRKTHFQKGKKVAWEWNQEYICGEAWYRDPDSGVIRKGWQESMEFVGRDLDNL